MKWKMPMATTVVYVSLFVWAACVSGLAQERSGTTGSATFGWASGENSSELDEGQSNPFTILQLDHKGIILDPRFLSYEISPRLSRGVEDFHTGQKVGSGIEFSTQLLPVSPWPFWLSYKRFRILSPITTDTSNGSTSNLSNLSLGGQYAVEGWPTVSVQYDGYKDYTDIDDLVLPLAENTGSRFSVSGDHRMKGWHLYGRIATDNDQFKRPGGTGTGLQDRDANRRLLDFSVQRDLGSHTMFRVSGFRNRTERFSDIVDSDFESQQIRSYLKYSVKKLQASIQYNNTQYYNRQELNLALTAPEDTNKVSTGKQSGDSLNSSLTYSILPYLSVSGDLRYARSTKTGGLTDIGESDTFYGSPGVRFDKAGAAWSVNAGYRLQFTPESLGHSAGAGFVVGDPSAVQVGGNFNWARTRIEQGLLLGKNQQIQGVALDVRKQVLGFMQVQVRGDFRKRTLDTLSRDTDDISRGFRVTLKMPKVQLMYSRRTADIDNWLYSWMSPFGTSMPTGVIDVSMPSAQLDDDLSFSYSDSQLRAHDLNAQQFTQSSPSGDLPAPDKEISIAETVPELISQFSSSNSSNRVLTAAFDIKRRMRLYGTWQDGSRVGELQAAGFNDSYSMDQKRVVFEWSLRQIHFEASYNLYRYHFGTGAYSFRKDVIIKITRHFRVF
jgi:hypothetical protein